MENDNVLITCKICGKQSTRIYGAHLKSHGLTSKEYLDMFPGSPLYTESDNKKTTKNSGKHMKEERYKKMFSEKIKGENNPNSKSRTTKEQRKQRSPFSKSFIKYKNENDANEFSKKVVENRKPESFNTKIEFWLKRGLDYDDAEKKLIERQKTFTLEKCIDKHGEETGRKIYKDRQDRWQKSLLDGGKLKSGFSQISQILFYDIFNKYPLERNTDVYFASINKEYFLRSEEKFYQYDFTDLNLHKMIEYNSDVYHANPIIYKKDDHPHPFRRWLTSKDIWDVDEDKLKMANEKGFEVLVIWDSEYRHRPDKVLQDCLDFLNLKPL